MIHVTVPEGRGAKFMFEDELQPTNKLRFVEREVIVDPHPTHATASQVRILQQWWEKQLTWGAGEWRDVPIEQEK